MGLKTVWIKENCCPLLGVIVCTKDNNEERFLRRLKELLSVVNIKAATFE